MALSDMIPGVAALKAIAAGLAGAAAAILLTVLFYEGVPLGPLRHVPLVGPALKTVLDGRVDRVVRRATKDLADAAELRAARAMAEAERMLRMAAQNRNAALEDANRRFSDQLRASETERESLDDQIAELLARPVDRACSVDADLYRRLRNR